MPPSTLDRLAILLDLVGREAESETPDVRVIAACVKKADALLTPLDDVPSGVLVESLKAQADLLRIAGPILAAAVLQMAPFVWRGFTYRRTEGA